MKLHWKDQVIYESSISFALEFFWKFLFRNQDLLATLTARSLPPPISSYQYCSGVAGANIKVAYYLSH